MVSNNQASIGRRNRFTRRSRHVAILLPGTAELVDLLAAAGPVQTAPLVGLVGFSGLSGDSLGGMDFRPSIGQLYARGAWGSLYTIDTVTGAATAIGPWSVDQTGAFGSGPKDSPVLG